MAARTIVITNAHTIHRKAAVMPMTSASTNPRRKRSPFWSVSVMAGSLWTWLGHDSASRRRRA